jgi:single-stranded-DNA-specific exonuclease
MGEGCAIKNSALGRNWQLARIDQDILHEFMRHPAQLSAIEAQILLNRGAKFEQISDIINPKLRTQMPDPNCLLGMQKAIEEIIKALKAKKNIVIFADYDVDGATSASILLCLFSLLEPIFGTCPQVFVPDRLRDGYGPSPQLMRSIKQAGADLLISVDCGAAAYSALEEAAIIGLDVIVFDHHLMDEIAPPALAIVNPNQFGDNSGLGHLTAAGVCFMAVVALNRELKAQNIDVGFNPLDLLDLVALGTVCDVAPLRGLNRVFVAQGQKVLGKLSRIGLAKLAQISGLKKADNVFACGWVLGPRLNAGGRIGDSSIATRLLTSNDEDNAQTLALQLEQLNAERRAIEQAVLEEAVQMAQKIDASHKLIIVGKAGWHPGIIGIVAGRLKEKFQKPVIVLGSQYEDETIAKGSGRSINGFNLGGLIKRCVEARILLSGGGHKMAAGLSVEFSRIEEITQLMNDMANDEAQIALENQTYSLDAVISLGAINLDTLNSLERLAPFGADWEEPKFLVQNARIIKSNYLNGGHLRVTIKDKNDDIQNAICFGAQGTKLGEILVSQQNCSLVIRIKSDDFRGTKSVSTEIIDAQYA